MATLLGRAIANGNPALGPVAIDWGHPLAQDLQACVMFGHWTPPTGIDLVKNVACTNAGTYGAHIDDKGIWLSGVEKLSVPGFHAGQALSVLRHSFDAQVFRTSTNIGAAICGYVTTTTTTAGYSVGIGNTTFDNNGNNLIGLNNNVIWHASTVPFFSSGWNHVAATNFADGLGGFTARFWIRGVFGSTGGNAVSATPTGCQFNIGWDESASPRIVPSSLAIQSARMWGRVLTPTEVSWLAAEPYAFLTQAPMAKRYFTFTGPIFTVNVSHALNAIAPSAPSALTPTRTTLAATNVAPAPTATISSLYDISVTSKAWSAAWAQAWIAAIATYGTFDTYHEPVIDRYREKGPW